MRTITALLLAAVIGLSLSACETTGYYQQLVQGHLSIVTSSVPLSEATIAAEPATAKKLELVQQALAFAEHELTLTSNGSYESYVDLSRPYVVQNLYAAEEFSTTLKHWCYPIIGCADYRGFFDEDQLLETQRKLVAQGYETHRSAVTAYSTLGWFKDPVLSTFVQLPDYRLVGLIFHELAHQQLYLPGATEFNESFATTVERAGLRHYYNDPGALELQHYERYLTTTAAIDSLAAETREALQELYASPINAAEKRERKAHILHGATRAYESVTGRTIEPLNNASLGVINTYRGLVPNFENLLAFANNDMALFLDRVRSVSTLPEDKRRSCILAWGNETQALDERPRCW